MQFTFNIAVKPSSQESHLLFKCVSLYTHNCFLHLFQFALIHFPICYTISKVDFCTKYDSLGSRRIKRLSQQYDIIVTQLYIVLGNFEPRDQLNYPNLEFHNFENSGIVSEATSRATAYNKVYYCSSFVLVNYIANHCQQVQATKLKLAQLRQNRQSTPPFTLSLVLQLVTIKPINIILGSTNVNQQIIKQSDYGKNITKDHSSYGLLDKRINITPKSNTPFDLQVNTATGIVEYCVFQIDSVRSASSTISCCIRCLSLSSIYTAYLCCYTRNTHFTK
ncbi:Hypothetical_protein [Hexamita inflata]|uniref:Hypothetical_protein n=1 Tax=Hexamita inflata TaxID=28002 RepID=A0AA86Q5I8_9EUKA|nr:Hypothetical protein HINF_LOCUS34112 [Hexamita inflata]CAI9946475.1 Hypothetical protein HINF_LOCUS34120 [Hexamita inflata]